MAKNKPNKTVKPGGEAQKSSGLGFYLFLGVVAVAGVAWLFVAGRNPGVPDAEPLSVADMEAEASGAAGVSMGPEDAPVTIIEFEDYRCPSCRQFNWQIGKPLRQAYATGDDAILRWVTYDYPIFGQPSWAPMIAGRCAEAQGRFWEMHDLLYARTEEWYGASNPNAAFIDLAEEVGLDADAFRECLAERPHLRDIAASRKYGESLGVGGTPTIYLNGRQVPSGQYDYGVLEERILEAAEVAAATAGPAGGADADATGEDGAAGGG